MYKILLSASLPTLRDRFVLYGARSESKTRACDTSKHTDSSNKWSPRLLDKVASLTVPHGWFLHFYVVSVASSIFWAYQILIFGHPLRILCANPGSKSPSSSMTADQIAVAWLLMAAQGLRRLFESIMFQRRSGSTMFVVHWVLGLSFYVAMGLAVWIEGAGEPPTPYVFKH